MAKYEITDMPPPRIRHWIPLFAVVIIITPITIVARMLPFFDMSILEDPLQSADSYLRFGRDNTFKILQLSDLHYGEAPDQPWGPEQDFNTTRVINKMLDYENPDFTVLVGDIVTGEGIHTLQDATTYYQIPLNTISSRNYKFASVFGNHDIGPAFDRHDLITIERNYSTSYTRAGPRTISGVSNYCLPVYAYQRRLKWWEKLYKWVKSTADIEVEKPSWMLYFMDSNGDSHTPNAPNWVNASQVAWLNKTITDTNVKFGAIPSLVFYHIPVYEYRITLEKHFTEECKGLVAEWDIAFQNGDEGFFKLLFESRVVKATFTGHDHGSGWRCSYSPYMNTTEDDGHRVDLCFGRHTGYGGYWQPSFGDRGARGILLNRDGSMNTWVRLENGSLIDPQ
ncbi:hypothetical protein SmJEL517_g05934 [Synchytrium microbalum]|uniref:Calcineurin-like phosphoesterase domain-containing protein n=1 Tax=Synchytrium microbalum TaxID=1806994 RepID=A0A507BYV1_9FUNG|nr:uncharacterized protein SmJEL517_g05934 [Synchytrium microbalum]TPX30515.1 hypothetical protein SmJEL517_g05934 [Synchytrium microbalum]